MIKVSNTSPQVLSPTASDPIHKEVREARVTHDGTILPSLKHANDYDYNQLDDKIDALSATSSTSLSVLQGAVDSLDTRLDVAEPKIATLQSEMTAEKAKITSLQSDMATEKPKITTLQSDMTAEKAKIVTLQADNNVNKANIATLQSGKADKLMASNLVSNGDFSNGTIGWALATNVGGVGEYTAPAKWGGAYNQVPNPSQLVGKKVYFSIQVKADSNLVGLSIPDLPTNTLNTTVRHSGSNNFERLSVIVTPTNGTDIRIKVVDERDSGWTKCYFDNAIAINLTQVFGAGNEPTLAEMDLLMSQFGNSWFDGTQELLSLKGVQKELSSKADKVQEAWITPTLINGATGTVQYRRNSTGRIEFRGSITVASTTTSMTLPASHRPTDGFKLPLVANDNTTGILVVQVTTGANIYFSTLKTFDMCGISFV